MAASNAADVEAREQATLFRSQLNEVLFYSFLFQMPAVVLFVANRPKSNLFVSNGPCSLLFLLLRPSLLFFSRLRWPSGR